MADMLALYELFTTLSRADCEVVAVGSELCLIPGVTLLLAGSGIGNEMCVVIKLALK
tara:strand:+ start:692 stop:862 length:171 start_codon:yes stop_codon:yes gene_type:complete